MPQLPPGLGAEAPAQASAETAQRFYRFLEDAFDRQLQRSPMTSQALLGRKDLQDRWDDLSDAAADESIAETRHDLARLQAEFNPDDLPQNAQLSYRLFEYEANARLEADAFRYHDYPVNQMTGWQSSIPTFLNNVHRIDTIEDAEAYVSRLEGVRPLVDQIIAGLEERARKGILAPKFVYDKVIRDCRNLLQGVPFHAAGTESTWFADFKTKVDNLSIAYKMKPQLMRSAIGAIVAYVGPAYRDLIVAAARLEALATTDDGAWKLPQGAEFYAHALKRITTTGLSAEDIHQFGLQEVSRIHGEMEDVIRDIGFEGDLQSFFRHVNDSSEFVYSNDEGGRTAYLTEATRVVDEMYAKLSTAFKTMPKAKLIVKRVEAFREQSAGLAFYEMPASDGSRPGVYYVNMSNMAVLKKFQLEALAYHEGVPGHHMQLAIAGELVGIPSFQKFGFHTAYAEGWGLYSELLAKELGGYRDAISDFGRLAMELWRATRLVVDTGIHAKRWTRARAITYLREVTPNPDAEIVGAVERYIVLPGQATAYKVGMRRIVDLRSRSRTALGSSFDLGEFHDIVLSYGAVPLDILDQLVEEWIRSKSSG
ncbi:DUF885 domain-containing protein [Mesorhizobium sp.]|uniref:DUF885 domain-containing protein n=1 Tax=Mesorhizobium sp. TaxID=1871066 RepID=UPI0025805DEB|nr:DUF885 domain-containing protein [Mesorhizobium sp.]